MGKNWKVGKIRKQKKLNGKIGGKIEKYIRKIGGKIDKVKRYGGKIGKLQKVEKLKS